MLADVIFRRAKKCGEAFSLLNFCKASLVVSDITGSSKRSAVGQSGQVFTISRAATVNSETKSASYKVNLLYLWIKVKALYKATDLSYFQCELVS